MTTSIQYQATDRRFKTARTIVALMLREMATSYGRSIAGYFWAVAEPVAAIIFLTFVFMLAMRSPFIGDNFPLYYASGYLAYNMYADLNMKIASSLRFSRSLLFYPGVTYADALIARALMNFTTQFMVTVLVLGGIIILYQVNVILDFPAMGIALLMAASFAIGVGTLNCFLFWRFPAWGRIWGVLTRPAFIISGVILPPEKVPAPYDEWLLWIPLVHITGQMRKGVYATYGAEYVSYVYTFGIAAVTMTLGLLLLGRYHREITNE